MRKTNNEILSDWERLDTINLEKAFYYLRKHEGDIRDYLINIVATVCDVDVNSMLSKNDTIYVVHARWMYWHAYRYMTRESYGKIAAHTAKMGHPFGLHSIQVGVNKISMMIESEPIWAKRWAIIKHIIKLRDTVSSNIKMDNTIVVQVPREIQDQVRIEVKTK